MASDSSALTAEGTAAYRREVEAAASALERALSAPPTVAIINDTGVEGLLGEEAMDDEVACGDLPHFPISDGSLRVGALGDQRVVVLDQQLHLYDGESPRTVTFPVRMLAEAGVETLLLPTTAGGVNPQFEQGDLMLVTNHVNLQGQNPLVGPNVEDWGPRFPDMTEPYAPRLQQVAEGVAREEGFSLKRGVYLALLGPNAETAAEHRMVRRLGGDAVGKSLVPEVIVARHMGLDVMGVALLTDQHLTETASVSSGPDAPAFLGQARTNLRRLLRGVVANVSSDPTPA